MSGEIPGHTPEGRQAYYYAMLVLLLFALAACNANEVVSTPTTMAMENNQPTATEVSSMFFTYEGKVTKGDGSLFGAIGRLGAEYYEQELVGTERQMNVNLVVDGAIPETVWPDLPWEIGFEEHSNGEERMVLLGEAGTIWSAADLLAKLGWMNYEGDGVFIAHENNSQAVIDWAEMRRGEKIRLESAEINVDNGLPYPTKSEGFLDFWFGDLPKEKGLERERIIEMLVDDKVVVFRGALIEGKGYVWTVGKMNRDRTAWEWYPIKLLKREMGRGRSLIEAVQSLEDAQSHRKKTRNESLAAIKGFRESQRRMVHVQMRQARGGI